MKNKSRKSLEAVTHTHTHTHTQGNLTERKNKVIPKTEWEKGITMVTLVVTVVIMLILIGITVNLTIGNNGIVTRTKQAKKDIEQTALNEQYQMNVLYDEMVATSGSNGDNINTDGIPDRIIEYIESKLEANTKDNMLKMYPIGSIYISTEATDPSELFGGTWESYGEGRTLVGVGTSDQKFIEGQTGGESQHILTEDEMPNHKHAISGIQIGGIGTSRTYLVIRDSMALIKSGGSGVWTTGTVTTDTDQSSYRLVRLGVDGSTATSSKGSNLAHNNLQPYIVTYMWKRIQ